jgi:hypothetical protein
MNVRRVVVLLTVVAASAGAAGRADAQYAYGCAGGYGGGYGFGAWDIGRLYGVLADNVPYYAAFPPVYYSVPVPRTYGYSPFAYPPGVMTPEVVEAAEPLSIANPYFQESSATAAEGDAAPADQTTQAPPAEQGAPKPLLVINPYVEQTSPALAGR